MLNLVCFEVNNTLWASGLAWIREVVLPLSLARLPNSPDYIKGMINVRGEVIPVFDGSALLLSNQSDTIKKPDSKILLFVSGKETFGLMVDSIRGVLNVTPENVKDIVKADGIHKIFAGAVIKGDNGSIILLNTENLIAFFMKNRRSAKAGKQPIA